MNFSVRVNEDDGEIIKAYAKMHGTTVSDVLRQAVIEKIEDEIAVKMADEAYGEYLSDPVTYTLDEVEEMLDGK